MILLVSDTMVHPRQTCAQFTVEPSDALQHGQLTGGAYLSRTGGMGVRQLSKENRLRPMPSAVWRILLDEGGKTLSREVSGRVGQLACPHERALDDVLDHLDTGACARGGPEGKSRRRDVLDLRNHPLPGISPRVKGLFQQRCESSSRHLDPFYRLVEAVSASTRIIERTGKRSGMTPKRLVSDLLVLGWIPTLMVAGSIRWRVSESVTAQERTPIKVTRIYTGADGTTHAEELDVPLGQPRGATELSEPVLATSIQFRRTSPDYFIDWHTAPRRQYVITLAGESEVEIGDGSTILLHPGHILLAEDTEGQGHISRAVGSEDRISIFVPLADQ